MRPVASLMQPAATQAARRMLHSKSALAGGSSTAINQARRLRSLAPSFIQSKYGKLVYLPVSRLALPPHY